MRIVFWNWCQDSYPRRLNHPLRRSLRGIGDGHIRSSVHRTQRLVATVRVLSRDGSGPDGSGRMSPFLPFTPFTVVEVG